MKLLTMLASCLLGILALDLPDIPPPTGSSDIVDAAARFELLYTRSAPITGGLTEGPAVAPDGSIYFSDIPVGKDKGLILRFDPKTKKTTVFTNDSGKSNGLKFDAQGYLIACEGSDDGGRRVSRWDVRTGKRETVVDKYMGKSFNAPNDLAIDLKGRIYFTDPRYLGDEPRELEHRAVYRLEPDVSLTELTHNCEKPNGIALSPDMQTLYLVDHNNGTDKIDPSAAPPKKGAMKLYAFYLTESGHVSSRRKVLMDFGTEDGIDGMAVDVKGNLYLAVRSLKRPGIWVTDAQGKELAYIPTAKPQPGAKQPVGIPSNCCFGIGEESKTLYVTVDKSLWRIPLKIDGFHIPFKK
jgi:gluconolactonase